MFWRVSNVEAFRQWESDDESELDDLLDKLRGDWPSSGLMEAGTAFHKALETAPMEGDFETLTALGHRFTFNGDFELSLTRIRELRGSGRYMVDGLPIHVSGQVDAIEGRRIEDHKTTGRFDPDRYLAGYQWRLYLDIFDADIFRWNVFEIAEQPSDDELLAFEVRSLHTLEQYRYPGLHEDCVSLVTRFARFVRDHADLLEQREDA